MKFFSKIVFICNICFVVMLVMQYIHIHNAQAGKADVVLPLPFVEGIMAVLGLVSLLTNSIFVLVYLFLIAVKKSKQIPLWLVWVNFIILIAQIYWFLID